MFKHSYLVSILLLMNLIYSFIYQFTISNSITITALCCLYGLVLFLESKKEPEINKELKEKIILLEDKINKVETKASALTLSSQFQRR